MGDGLGEGSWVRAGRPDEVPDEEGLVVPIEPPIAVFCDEGTYYAIADTCSHENYSLAEGYREGAEVVCPAHLARFSLRTGEALCQPATTAVATFPVRVENGSVDVFVAAEWGGAAKDEENGDGHGMA